MKTFEVELRRTSYITVHVVANDEDHAEELAWEEVESRDDESYANWEVESIEEVKPTEGEMK